MYQIINLFSGLNNKVTKSRIFLICYNSKFTLISKEILTNKVQEESRTEIDPTCFESFGNGNFPSVNNKENDDSNQIKYSNDDIINKLKSKLNALTPTSNLTNQSLPSLKISDSPINKSINEISFDMDCSLLKNNSVKVFKDENKIQNHKKLPTFGINPKNLSQFVNRNTHQNRVAHKVPKKASSSCEFRKKNVHLSDSSITSVATSLSSKRNYRQNSTSNILERKILTDQGGNDDPKKRTKMFYKNIKNIKSKYSDLMKANKNLTTKGSNFIGIKLDQYINAKLNDIKQC